MIGIILYLTSFYCFLLSLLVNDSVTIIIFNCKREEATKIEDNKRKNNLAKVGITVMPYDKLAPLPEGKP
jgi:hypothetical protein